MSSFDLDSWDYRPPQTLREVFFDGFGDAAHWALGVMGLALWGFVSVMTGLGAFGVHLRLGGWRRREDRRRRGTMGGIMWGIVILVGTAKYPPPSRFFKFSPPFPLLMELLFCCSVVLLLGCCLSLSDWFYAFLAHLNMSV